MKCDQRCPDCDEECDTESYGDQERHDIHYHFVGETEKTHVWKSSP